MSEDGAGRHIIRAGDNSNFSLAEQISHQLRRLLWRTPLPGLTLGGKAPLKIVATPKDPIAGDKAAGEALLRGFVLRGGKEYPLEGFDFADTSLEEGLSDHMQSFAWLRDLAAAATRERGVKTAEKLMRAWLKTHGAAPDPHGWRADLWGRRILFWTAYAPYILSSNDAAYRTETLTALGSGIRYLDRQADKALPGLARITAWGGLVGAWLLVQGAGRGGNSEAGLLRALDAALHDDGGLKSRSPTHQLALAELLAQLRAAYFAGHRTMPDELREMLEAVAAVLTGTCLGDESLSSWQGGNMGAKRRVFAAIEGSGTAARALRHIRGWGYQRMEAKKSVVIMDAAPPPPSRALAGGCASTLAFEFSDGPQRIIVNCGGPGLHRGKLHPELVRGLRTTAAHSTITLGDRNSTAIHEDGTLGKGVGEVDLARDVTGGAVMIEASHDGYVRRSGLVHQRQLTLASDGLELRGEDRLIAKGRQRRRAAPVPFSARFHLAPAVEVATTADGQGALLRVRGATGWQFRCRGGALSIEESVWIDGDGNPCPTRQLVVSGESPPDGISLSWVLKRAR